ncbi:MAG: glycosyltransferase [Rhodospirillales bacterium]|nr:MAG: glycosyltransferase [Rhodospirillales bacterium]
MVVIDTEEEFDWGKPLARSNTSVRSIAAQGLAQRVFRSYSLTPTYVIDYPVATDPAAVRTLRSFADEGHAIIGAHLHPWVNPPDEEAVTPWNSYAGNLPAALEYDKLARLTDAIEHNFGARPTAYKAGRYGIGPNTDAALMRLGYHVDMSVVPRTSFAADGGPDFSAWDFRPYWFGPDRQLLEIPLSCGYAGALWRYGGRVYRAAGSKYGIALRAHGILARTRLLERIRLTPEGVDDAAVIRLTKSLLRKGCTIFTLTYHSPSLSPGCTPYVRDQIELKAFLRRLDRYLDHFLTRLGGVPATPAAVRALALGGGNCVDDAGDAHGGPPSAVR